MIVGKSYQTSFDFAVWDSPAGHGGYTAVGHVKVGESFLVVERAKDTKLKFSEPVTGPVSSGEGFLCHFKVLGPNALGWMSVYKEVADALIVIGKWDDGVTNLEEVA